MRELWEFFFCPQHGLIGNPANLAVFVPALAGMRVWFCSVRNKLRG